MKKRVLSVLLALLLILGTVPAIGAVEGEPVTLDLTSGSIVITATGYSIGGGEETPYTGAYHLIQSDPTPTAHTVTVSSGEHTIVVGSSVTIDVYTTASACAFGIASGAKVDLQLEQELNLRSGTGRAGLEVPAGAELTISATTDTGCLMAEGGTYGAGIGGGDDTGCGNLTIASGYIVAQGGGSGAGIGGGYTHGTQPEGLIQITGGIVEATGGSSGAGIGGGFYGDGTGENGKILISGGEVTAKSGSDAAGIGGGYQGDGTGTGGTIEITSTASVTAEGACSVAYDGEGYGTAGIGGGYGSNGTGTNGQLLIGGSAQVEAVGYVYGAGIGGGTFFRSSSSSYNSIGHGTGLQGMIKIFGDAKVHAFCQSSNSNLPSAAGIGGGKSGAGTEENGKIWITDRASVTASSDRGSSIGEGYDGYAVKTGGTIQIDGQATVNASSNYGAGIGGDCRGSDTRTIRIGGQSQIEAYSKNRTAIGASGENYLGPGTRLYIEDQAQVHAKADGNYPAIGGYIFEGSVQIFGGSILAEAPNSCAIGGSSNGSGTIAQTGGHLTAKGKYSVGKAHSATFTGGTAVLNGSKVIPLSTSLMGNAWVIADLAAKPDTFRSGVLMGKNDGAIYGKLNRYTLTEDKEIPEGFVLTVAEDQQLIVPEGKTLTVNGTLRVLGEVVENGKVVVGPTGKVSGFKHNHTLENVVGTPATCTATGIVSHWHCTDCGMNFADATAEQELETITAPINPENHTGETEFRNAKEATCTQAGRTGDVYCKACGQKIKNGVEIAPTGHRYDQNGVCTICKQRENPDLPVISVSSVDMAHAGEMVSLVVSMKNNPGITAMGLDLSYDPAQLKLVSVEDLGLLVQPSLDPSCEANPYGLYWNDYDAKENNTKNGDLVKLNFQVLPDCVTECTWVQLSFNSHNILNWENQPVTFALTSGSVQVVSTMYGDVNGDRLVDQKDVTQLGRTLGSWKDYSVPKLAADVDLSNEVNVVDLGMLTRCVSKWPNVQLGVKPAKPPVTLQSAGNGVITVSDGKGQAGQQVQLAVSLAENPGISLANLRVDYDETQLRLVKAANGSVLQNFESPEIPEKQPYQLLWNDSTVEDTDYRTGDLAILTFEILPDAAGTTEVRVISGRSDVVDAYLQPVPMELSAGTIEIIPSDKVDLSAQWQNPGVLEITATAKELPVRGMVFCAAYDGAGKMLAVQQESVTLEARATATVTMEVVQATKYKIFFLDGNYSPAAKAADPK